MNNTNEQILSKEEEQVTTKKSKFKKLKEGLKKLPDKKAHLDFVAALLTIPVLLSVIFINLNNISQKGNSANKTTPTPAPVTSPVPTTAPEKQQAPIIIESAGPTASPAATTQACIQDIGPISISSPTEGQTITDNPVCITINYQQGNYCSAVWSYSINGSSWSDYSNNAPCLYNLPQGQNTFNLRVKSLASSSTQTLQRSFIYKGSASLPTPTNTPTPTATSSATTQ